MSEEYFLIAVPQQSSIENALDTISRLTNPNQLSTNYTFHIPDLKVNTREKKEFIDFDRFICFRLELSIL